jgi:integrase
VNRRAGHGRCHSPRGARSRLSVGNYRRLYRLAVARAELPELDPHGPHDLRHTFATWLEDRGVPARVIAERLAVALAAMPQVCPKHESGRGRRAEARRDTAVDLRIRGVELRGFEP